MQLSLTGHGFDVPRAAAPTTVPAKRAQKPKPPPMSDADTVLAVLTKRGDLTASEIASLCSLTATEVCRRTRGLARAGLARDTGERRTSSLGKPSIVWSAN